MGALFGHTHTVTRAHAFLSADDTGDPQLPIQNRPDLITCTAEDGALFHSSPPVVVAQERESQKERESKREPDFSFLGKRTKSLAGKAGNHILQVALSPVLGILF